LLIVRPETVVRWHRERFRRYWTHLSNENRRPGRPPIDLELRTLIRRMARENPWGAPRIHGELLKLGFVVSEATVSPTSVWVIQQLREAFPFDTAPRHLIFDRDATFSAAVVGFVRSMGTKPCRTAPRSPWQNGLAALDR
jgi:hypothetical protein